MNKLYETNSMLRECNATVVSCTPLDKGFEVTLDNSILFPEGGGQLADLGTLTYEGHCIQVLDGQERKLTDDEEDTDGSGRIARYLVKEEIPAGTNVTCRLNWDLRFSRMQQHSGEHVLTGLAHGKYGYDNVSFHLSDDSPVTVCFSGPLTDEQIADLERQANEVVYQNLPIVDTYPTKEALAAMTYRSKIEIQGQVRIITVGGINMQGEEQIIDVCACCAPHVPSTAYIGIIKVVSSQSYKGGTQLNILCGRRAVEYLMKEHSMIAALARDFSTAIEELPTVVTSQRAALNDSEQKLAAYLEQGYLNDIAEMKEDAVPCIFYPDMSAHAMKICYNELVQKYNRHCGVFSGDDNTGYRFYAGNPNLNSAELTGPMRTKLDAKGGGSKEMIQGKVARSEAEIREFFNSLS